ncbi:MAG: hypothetical protein R2705_05460 [Ilumatobacteraceae bacterium]
MSGQLVTLLDPIRVYDSRSDTTLLGGSRLASGSSILVTVSAAYEGFVSAVFANITATDTVGWDSSACAGPTDREPCPTLDVQRELVGDRSDLGQPRTHDRRRGAGHRDLLRWRWGSPRHRRHPGVRSVRRVTTH